MSEDYAHDLHREHRSTDRTHAATHARAARVVLSLGPLTMLAGAAWALVQPYRITLLHPLGQGFWWLVSEPPLYVVLFGVLFHVVVARPLVDDLERHR
jgi:hypothetical protein